MMNRRAGGRTGWWAVAIAGSLVGAFSSVLPGQEFVYVSSVTGVERDGRALRSIEDQTTRALDRVGEMLRERGLGYGDVVAANVFLKDARHFPAMNEIYRRYFATNPPTRATVQADLPDPGALIQISVVATSAAKQVINPRRMRTPALPYSWGIKVGNALFIAGATARDPETYQPIGGDVGAQTRRIFGNIGLVLEEAGMGYGDLTSCRVFLDDARRFGEMNRAYAEFVLAEDPPARATVRASLMNPAFEVEIQCVAERSHGRWVVIGEGRQRSRSPFSPAISTGDRLYLAGMVGSGQGGVPPDVQAQTTNTLANVRATLAAAGMDWTHVTDAWVYLTDIRQLAEVRRVMAEVLPEGMPPATIIGTPLMGSRLLVEIQMTAQR